MESRLPRPQFGLKKVINVPNVNAQPNASSAQAMEKSKSIQNLQSKTCNENLPPPRRVLRRSVTMSSITRSEVNLLTATKRPGPVVDAVSTEQAKKIKIQGAVPKKLPTGAATKKKESAKPPAKWDFKGRVAYAIEELNSTRETCREIEEKNVLLETQIEELRTKELNYRLRVEDFNRRNEDLTTEITDSKRNISGLHAEEESLKEQLPILEEQIETSTENLKISREKNRKRDMELSKLKDEIAMLVNSVDSMKKQIRKEIEVKEGAQSKLLALDIERRQIHNKLQELKGNIRVFCRVRPALRKENSKGSCSITFPDDFTIEVGKSEGTEGQSFRTRVRENIHSFNFDKVFPPTSTQAYIFEELSLLVQSALEGYNVCVFAYGQTGSGKTYTMEGGPDAESEGMIPRTVKHIFAEKHQFELHGWEYAIEASFLEIYNEQIVDLLDSESKTHEIRMTDKKGTDVYVTNLRIVEIHSPEELQDCLRTAQRNRAVAATQSNERSSRSHSVTRIRLTGTHMGQGEVCVGNLNLVDLAGSERFRNVEAVRTNETKNINKSLANLGNVILALSKKQDHIPYRNSKLTHFLMPSLGGNSKTLMLLNVSPLEECYGETLNSLRFASNVINCKTGTVVRTRTALQKPT